MRADKTNAAELFKTDDVVIGFGEVQAVRTDKGTGWILPGRVITYLREEAEHHARRLDALIRANLPRYERSLV